MRNSSLWPELDGVEVGRAMAKYTHTPIAVLDSGPSGPHQLIWASVSPWARFQHFPPRVHCVLSTLG